MYNDHYGFRCTPFDDRADTQFTYVTPDLEEVLAGLEYEARFGKGVALVLGEAGVGKTQTLRALLLRLHSTDHAVVVSVPPSGEFDPIREACKGFGVSLPSSGGQLSRRMARLRRHLSRNTQAGHRSILILDQGENLTSAGLSQLATLTELQDEHGRLLCVFLFGQPRLQRQLEAPEFARLLQQFTGERYLHPLSAEQTAEYIRHRLRVAGAGDPELIDPEALHLIFAASNGVPRLINHFTNEALVTAYAAGSSCVTAAMVDEVIGATESRTRSARLEDLGLQPARMGSGGGLSAQPTPRTAQRAPQPVQRAARTERMTTTPPISSASRETSRDDWDVERVPAETFGTPTAFEGPGVVVSAAAPAALSNSLETLFSQGSDLLERLERVLAKAERTCSVSDASLTQHAAVEKHLSTLSAGAERVLRSLTDGVDQAQRTMREAPRRLEEALLASESRLAQVDGKIAAISQIEERAGQRSGRIETLQRQVADAEERLQDVLRELEAKAESASQQSKRMTDDLVATSRVRPDAERIIARLTEQAKELAEQAKESDARAASIEVRERRSAERTRELRAELEALDAKATTVIESVGRELEGLVASARERVQAQLGELKRSEDIVGRVEVSLQPIAEKATSRFREQIASLQQAAVEGLRGTLETLSRKREDVSGLLLELEAGARTLQTRSDEAVARIEATTEPVVQRTAARCREQLQEQATTLQRLYEEKLAAGLVEHRARVEEVLTSTQHRTEESRLVIEGVERRQRSLEMAIAPLSDKVSNAAIAVSGLNEKADGLGEKARGLTETVDRLGQTVAAIHTAAGTEVAQVETLSDRASTMKGELNEAVERAREILAETEVAEGTVATIRQTVSASVREMTQAAERVGTLREKVAAWEQTAVRIERDVAVGQACADDLNSATESAAEIRRALQALTTESAERVGQLDSHNASASRVRNELAEANAAANVALQRIEADRRTLEGLVRDANGATERFTVAQVTGAETVAQLDELVEIAQSAYRRADDAVAEVEIRTATLSTGCKDAEGVLQRISQCERSTSQIVEKANQTSQHAEKTAAATASTVDRLLKEVWSLTGKTETTAKQLEAAHSRSSELLGKLTQAAGPADAVVQKLSGLFPRVEDKTKPVTAARGAAAAPAAETPRIPKDQFGRVELRVAEVLAAEAVPKSKKLLKLTVSLGSEQRTVVAGIAEHYAPGDLVGKKIVIVANLEPAKLMGVESQGMILAGSADGRLAVLTVDRDLPAGAKVS